MHFIRNAIERARGSIDNGKKEQKKNNNIQENSIYIYMHACVYVCVWVKQNIKCKQNRVK